MLLFVRNSPIHFCPLIFLRMLAFDSKLPAWSDTILMGFPLTATKRLNAYNADKAVPFGTPSRCTARVAAHVKSRTLCVCNWWRWIRYVRVTGQVDFKRTCHVYSHHLERSGRPQPVFYHFLMMVLNYQPRDMAMRRLFYLKGFPQLRLFLIW